MRPAPGRGGAESHAPGDRRQGARGV